MLGKLIIGIVMGFLFGFAMTEIEIMRIWLRNAFDVTDVENKTLIVTSAIGMAIGFFFALIDR